MTLLFGIYICVTVYIFPIIYDHIPQSDAETIQTVFKCRFFRTFQLLWMANLVTVSGKTAMIVSEYTLIFADRREKYQHTRIFWRNSTINAFAKRFARNISNYTQKFLVFASLRAFFLSLHNQCLTATSHTLSKIVLTIVVTIAKLKSASPTWIKNNFGTNYTANEHRMLEKTDSHK